MTFSVETSRLDPGRLALERAGRPQWLVVGRELRDAERIAANLFERLASADMVAAPYNGFTQFLNAGRPTSPMGTPSNRLFAS